MKTQFIETGTRYQATKACQWAIKTAKVCGGYICFESIIDYKIWKNQK